MEGKAWKGGEPRGPCWSELGLALHSEQVRIRLSQPQSPQGEVEQGSGPRIFSPLFRFFFALDSDSSLLRGSVAGQLRSELPVQQEPGAGQKQEAEGVRPTVPSLRRHRASESPGERLFRHQQLHLPLPVHWKLDGRENGLPTGRV